jgi:hypothetical protein
MEQTETTTTVETPRATGPEISLECLKDTVLFSCSVKAWSNKAKCKDTRALEAYYMIKNGKPGIVAVPDEEAQDGNDKRVTAAKVLVRSKALDKLRDELRTVKKRAMSFAMPSFMSGRGGSYVVKRDCIPALVKLVKEGRQQIRETALPAFIADYPDAKERARVNPVVLSPDERKRGMEPGLGPLWREEDYPGASELEKKFDVQYSFFALTVPEGLPPEVRAEEERKLRAQYQEAVVSMRDALREMFGRLLDNAVDKLAPKAGEKPKRFNDTLVGNLLEFFETFEARNITGDAELAELVKRCKGVMTGVSPDRLRTDFDFKSATGAALAEIKAKLDPMIEDTEERAFDFSED